MTILRDSTGVAYGSQLSNTSKIVIGVVALLGLLMLYSAVTVVGTGHRGVRTFFGDVRGQPLPEGLYFNIPGVTNIISMDIRTQKFHEVTEVATQDVQMAQVEYTVNYSIKGSEAGNLYKTVGDNYAAMLIPQVIQGGLKDATGRVQAVDIISHREEIRKHVMDALVVTLAERGIVVEGFQITNIDFSHEFDGAVEAKVIAIQQADQAKNQTVRVEEEAKQRVIAATADATAMKIKSEALSQNQNLIQYEAVQKWNGVLPTMTMGGAVPFINLDGMKSK
jgi:regulator of protease activity HflC (stomatin/prohibitin superfamily)